MKKWENPELKVFSVKMSENIAASGKIIVHIVLMKQGAISHGDFDYWCDSTREIQDTGLKWYDAGGEKCVNVSDSTGYEVEGCRVR